MPNINGQMVNSDAIERLRSCYDNYWIDATDDGIYGYEEDEEEE